MSDIPLGTNPTGDASRDAIHVAIFPAIANEKLSPGQHVGLVRHGDTESVGRSRYRIGIIDPFLKKDVSKGERCWVCLYPQTVTGMRHHWQHPDFPEETPVLGDSEAVIRRCADQCGISFDRMLDVATDYAESGSWEHMGENEGYKDVEDWKEFWLHFEKYSGLSVDDHEAVPFSCSC